ncbi:hypothetical protein PSAC2689_60376 [Paraburkholderia sacchari]
MCVRAVSRASESCSPDSPQFTAIAHIAAAQFDVELSSFVQRTEWFHAYQTCSRAAH